MFLWYIEWASKDHQHETGVPDSPDWQAKLIEEALGPVVLPPGGQQPEPKRPSPPLKKAG